MPFKMSFLGGVQSVTGSRYLVEANGKRVMVDCGMCQERDCGDRNWEPFPVPPSSIDALLLTHAHLDHIGYIPKFVRDGFRGPIYCTEATAEITRISLLDSARIQEEDAEYKKKRHQREGRRGRFPEMPLYTVEDAENSLPQFRPVPYDAPVNLGPGVSAEFNEAGHILGSAMIRLVVNQNGQERSVVFSGDMGRPELPILRHPTVYEEADYILCESTYGDRLHESQESVKSELAEVINWSNRAGGNIVIPAFAVERAQEILYHLSELLAEKAIPPLMVMLDSPMAVAVTKVFKTHEDLYDRPAIARTRRGGSPFDFPGLHLVTTTDESKSINQIKGTAIIIAGSGMCTGGRVKHHLVTNISRPESTVLFVGYQAQGTLGRQIIDGAPTVRIFGQQRPVKARIAKINGFSGHADRDELLQWLSAFKFPPRRLFVVHGEPEAARSFAGLVADKLHWPVAVPEYNEEVMLD